MKEYGKGVNKTIEELKKMGPPSEANEMDSGDSTDEMKKKKKKYKLAKKGDTGTDPDGMDWVEVI